LKDFPVTVDYINRFKSAKEKKETLKKLEEGKAVSCRTFQKILRQYRNPILKNFCII
jgi:hypothetical protein